MMYSNPKHNDIDQEDEVILTVSSILGGLTVSVLLGLIALAWAVLGN